MEVLGRKCPRCGSFVWRGKRFCGSCGFDLESEEREEPAPIERLYPERPAASAWSDEPPRPTETARFVGGDRTAGMSRKDLIKLACGIAAALVIIVIAIVLIARMNRTTPPPVSEAADTADTVHVIEAGGDLLTTAAPRPTATPRPTNPPAATVLPMNTPVMVSEVSGVVYALPAALEIRSGPGAEYDVIATVAQGTELTRTGVMDGWTRVLVDGREGYVPHDQIAMEPEPTPTPNMDFEVDDADDTVVVDSGANLRLGPGTEYDAVGYADAGEEFHRTGTIEGWSQVEYGGGKAYVYNELLRSEQTPPPTDTPLPEEEQTQAPAESFSESTVTLRMNANVRTGPGTEYDVIGLADGGSTLEATELVDGWYKVTFFGQTGYVLASLTE